MSTGTGTGTGTLCRHFEGFYCTRLFFLLSKTNVPMDLQLQYALCYGAVLVEGQVRPSKGSSHSLPVPTIRGTSRYCYCITVTDILY
jgi:hypothetical protein